MKTRKTRLLVMLAVTLIGCMLASNAMACTSIYVGKALTADGSVIFARSEDYANSQNKLFYVAEAGKHAAGELYNGCYGFSWTFTHDSYGYTAFSDDNGEGVGGICPDCGGDHEHTPYEAGGTNDQGLSLTATETINGDDALQEIDPYENLGIEEAEIVTVLLGEASTAKEAVELLASIYDEAGANAGSGIYIGDANETWYIENTTGHQYIAVKLSDTMIVVQPNMVIIGAIDLDDTENVIASAGLIETAKQAGTFVGDEEANIINYVLSYAVTTKANARMVDALAFLQPAEYEGKDADTIDPASSYMISNVDAEGAITTMYTGIKAEGLNTVDVQNFYHIASIGQVRNLETHIFQITDASATGTVEWVAIDDASLSVFVPYYPMLTTDVAEAYKLSTAEAEFVEEQPEGGVYYPTTVNRRVNGERVAVEGFKVFPEVWKESIYWTNDVLSNTVKYCGLDEETVQSVYAAVYAQQDEINKSFETFSAGEVNAETATQFSKATAEKAHADALALAEQLIGG